MTSSQLNLIAPLDAPLPPHTEGEVLTESQWTTLMAIADTVVPVIQASSTHSTNALCIQASKYANATAKLKQRLLSEVNSDLPNEYLQENASSIPGFKELLRRTIGDYIREDARKGIRVILSALDTRAGCLLTTGYTTSFHLQPVNVRHQILQNWAKSYLPPLRQGAKALEQLVTSVWIKTSPTVGPILGFPRAPVHGKPGKGFEYNFLQLASGPEPQILDTDVVIVGSGCGGAVCAKNLAEAGHRVIVVDKSYHWGPEHLPMTERDSGIHLFANGGIESVDDGSICVIAGQAWGGGGTVNWSASLQTQSFVRREWAEKGLPFFTSSEFQDSLDRVCHRMGVSTEHVEHNINNKTLSEGARKLGYSYKMVPQNTGGNQHYCGYCTMGCGAAEKQGPVVSFLPDAEKAGAQFIEGFDAQRILFEDIKGKKTATGVQGRWVSRDTSGGVQGDDRTLREVVIKAKRVIVSAGTLQSPLLLLRSGLANPQIGKNLYLHPVTLVSAIYPNDPPINPWEGAILTSVVDEFQNLDGHGHGIKLECMTMLPSWVLPFQAWNGGLDFKMLCAKMPHMTSHIALTRERDSGRVYPDPVDGKCRIAYTPSAFDKKHTMEGVLALAKIAYVQGAKEIITTTVGMPPFERSDDAAANSGDGINDPAFQAWLAEVKKRGLNPPETGWGSAHQMGTCRMASTPRAGVVDPEGKVWGAEGLYVADASVFPSASGVNPMITNMAISDWISRGIAKGLQATVEFEERARL
ncbi:long-chain-alcohol oxidase, partial [Lecanoromycetidae sp. Uapishka_2]